MSDLDRRALLTGGLTLVAAAVAGGWAWLLHGQGEASPESAAAPSPRTSRVAPRTTPPGASAEAPTPTPSPSPSATPSPEPSPAPEPTVVLVLCREAWGAKPPTGPYTEQSLDQITIHHTGVLLEDNRKAPARFRQHQRYHQESGWVDIAYHYGVDRHGNCYALRPVTAVGDTFTDYDPRGHVLLVAEGNFDEQDPTDAQVATLATLCAWAAGAFGLDLSTVHGHREFASTSCPGDALQARLPEIRQRGGQLLAAGGVRLSSLCGAPGDDRVAAIEAGTA